MKLSVIIPMYNEAQGIVESATRLSLYCEEHFSEYEILFFDDGSTDTCAELVEGLSLPSVRVIRGGCNQGKGAAVRSAMLAADGEIRLFTDADLAYGTDVIETFYQTMLDDKETEVLLGSRRLRRDGYESYTPLRRVMSKAYMRVLRWVGGIRVSDSQCGCKAFSANAAREIFSRCTVDGFAFDFEVILWAERLGLPVREIPVRVLKHQESSIRVIRDTMKMLSDVRKIKKKVVKK